MLDRGDLLLFLRIALLALVAGGAVIWAAFVLALAVRVALTVCCGPAD